MSWEWIVGFALATIAAIIYAYAFVIYASCLYYAIRLGRKWHVMLAMMLFTMGATYIYITTMLYEFDSMIAGYGIEPPHVVKVLGRALMILAGLAIWYVLSKPNGEEYFKEIDKFKLDKINKKREDLL